MQKSAYSNKITVCITLHGAMNELSSDNDLFIYVKSHTIATNFNNIFDIAICYSQYCILKANLMPMAVRMKNEDIPGNSLNMSGNQTS